MHKGKEKKKPPQLTWFVPDTQDFLFVAVQIMDGREREVVCFILPDRSEFDLWYYCVCFYHSCVQPTNDQSRGAL